MGRLAKVTRLKEIEENLELIEINLRAVESFYFEEGRIKIFVDTKDFKEKGDCSNIYFTKQNMIRFLRMEKELLEKESKEIINILSERE